MLIKSADSCASEPDFPDFYGIIKINRLFFKEKFMNYPNLFYRKCIKIFFLSLLSLLCCISIAVGEEEETAYTDTDDLRQSVETSLQVEKNNLANLEDEISLLAESEKKLTDERKFYRIQISTYSNLLHLPDVSSEELETAMNSHQITVNNIEEHLKDLIQKKDIFKKRLIQAEEQYMLNEKQFYEINTAGQNSSETQDLVEKLQSLMKLLGMKIKHLETLVDFYEKQSAALTEIRNEFSGFSGKFAQQIQERKKEQLFVRKDNPLVLLNFAKISAEVKTLHQTVSRFFSAAYWKKTASDIWRFSGFFASGFFLLLLFLFTGGRANRMMHCSEDQNIRDYPWITMTVGIFRASLSLFIVTVFVYFFFTLHKIYVILPFVKVIFRILLILLFTRWTLNVCTHFTSFPPHLLSPLRSGIHLICYLTMIYVISEWLLGENSVILLLIRLVSEILVFALCLAFWKACRNHSASAPSADSAKHFRGRNAAEAVSYIILAGGMIPEFFGYGFFAVFWYSAWGYTWIILLWAVLIFLSLREWHQKKKGVSGQEDGDTPFHSDSIKWFAMLLCWPLWGFAVFIALFAVWGGRESLFSALADIWKSPLQIGGISLSINGFIYAFIILSLIHVSTRLWKDRLADVIFPLEKIDRGTKNSITSITIYIVWGLGIILSLSLIGISAASLAVVFGAMSVGLGFGLQNIFNNFISGIILLFERPIQVGDVVEINGIWGEIKKINIRSTQVQTYDNASLIIPNSEFISSQVTNWSFKDMRIRRRLAVGVAYGSDLELVRNILLDLTQNTPHVLTDPAPSIVFDGFGDSSINFIIRYWTHLDYFFTTQTDIFFEINRIFKEKGISIPFPQRDVHLFRTDTDSIPKDLQKTE